MFAKFFNRNHNQVPAVDGTAQKSSRAHWAMLAGLFALMAYQSVYAGGNSSAAFDDIADFLKDNMQGTLGMIFAFLVFITGAATASKTGSIFFVVLGIGVAIIMLYAPDVIESLMTASAQMDIPGLTAESLQHFSNGLVN